ncbi:MAG: hypothetical protein RL248_1144 [Pseudomonadota bacterium]|jgi:hypothetical protein
MDEMTRQLRHEGLHPQPAFLAGCGLLIGQQVELYPYRLIYRIDAGNLILCNFNRVPDSVPQLSSLFRLWGILRRLLHHISGLNCIRMLVITEVFDPQVAAQRQQLVRLLHRMGAAAVFYDGDNWLEISLDRLLNRRKRL